MKNKLAFIYSFIMASLIILAGCNQSAKETSNKLESEDSLVLAEINKHEVDEQGSSIPIYYNMYLTVELSSLFENEGAVYTESILNPVDKVKEYITSAEKALNLGVYAVDLSYARVFEQYQKAGSYFSAMYRLSEELGIPEDFIYSTSDRLERNISNKDSLTKIANEIYTKTDQYLKENDRENASALIILGGWVEALYIASKVFDLENENEDFEYMERMAEQKYSIVKLIKLLSTFKNDDTIQKILPKLKELQPIFEAFIVSPENIQSSIDQLNKVNEKITEIRKEIIG